MLVKLYTTIFKGVTMNFNKLFSDTLSNGSYAFGMQQDTATALQQQKDQLVSLVSSGNQALQSIAAAGVMSAKDGQKLAQIANDVTSTTSVIDDLVTKIKATQTSNAKDSKPEAFFEDAFGDVGDVFQKHQKFLQRFFQLSNKLKLINHTLQINSMQALKQHMKKLLQQKQRNKHLIFLKKGSDIRGPFFILLFSFDQ